MEHYLNTNGGNYTCTECGAVKAVMSEAKELNMKCCKGNSVVKHIQGNVKVAPKNATIVPPTPAPAPKEVLPPAPEVFNPSAQHNTKVEAPKAPSPVIPAK